MAKANGFSVSSTKAVFYQLNGASRGWSPIAVKRLTGNLPPLSSLSPNTLNDALSQKARRLTYPRLTISRL